MASVTERFWPEEALDFGEAVTGALDRAGGIALARRCEQNPGLRNTLVRPLLEELGLLELDPGTGELEMAASARAVLAAGRTLCPWPLVPRLACTGSYRHQVDAIYLADGIPRRLEHADLCGRIGIVDIRSLRVSRLEVCGDVDPMPLDPFGVPVMGGDWLREDSVQMPGSGSLQAMSTVLSAFWVCGALATARDLAAIHAHDRRQFGRRIAEFGAVQWHLSEVALAHDSLWELASFSLSRLMQARLSAADTLALHLTILDSAHSTLRHAHQVLAATGLCEEHDLGFLDRHLQPLLRRPTGANTILGLLGDAIERGGFDAIHPIEPVSDPVPAVVVPV